MYLVPVLFTFYTQGVLKLKKIIPSSKGSGKDRVLSFKGGSSRSHNVESSLCKRLWTCRKAECLKNEGISYRLGIINYLFLSVKRGRKKASYVGVPGF